MHSGRIFLSVIIPTYNERESLPALLRRLEAISAGLAMEAVIVDDASPDGTGALAEALGAQAAFPVRVIHRSRKAGLASAVIDGAAAARGEIVIVMDADLSHPPELLPRLVEAAGAVDVVVASRYVAGGGVERWPWPRRMVSRGATALVRRLLRLPVHDPLSGFFAVRRDLLTAGSYLGWGYKLLVEILARNPSRRVAEVPYRFVNRTRGRSKLTAEETWAFVRLLAHLNVVQRR